MKRAASAVLLAACGAAGVALALAVVHVPAAGADEGTTGTTGTTVTETTPPTTPEPPPPTPKVIAPGVTIGKLLVGGLTREEATDLVRARFARSLTLVVSPTRKIRVTPQEVRAQADVKKAIGIALRVKREGYAVPLSVTVDQSKVAGLLRRLAARVDLAAVDAKLILTGRKPRAQGSLDGRRLKQVVSGRLITHAFRAHDRAPVALPFDAVRPAVTEADFEKVIVIRRGSKLLDLYVNLKLSRQFRVATGTSSYPTPVGRFEIINMQRNPWWYPPQGSEWAAGKEPVPPGPGNPLGTRWMGISSPYVGIHGTPDAASIGYSASHGCIRMLIPQVEWLFERVDVGTPVFIVPN